MRRYWNEVKRSFRLYLKHKDVDHLLDIGRLTKYYIQK